jgi:hypothetical protein
MGLCWGSWDLDATIAGQGFLGNCRNGRLISAGTAVAGTSLLRARDRRRERCSLPT